MSARRFRPRRRLSSEIIPLASVLVTGFAIYAIFPEGVGFLRFGRVAAVRTDPPVEASCAFVTLTPEEETAALAAARTSWQGSSKSVRPRVEMLPTELPQTPVSPALELEDRPSETISFRARPHVRTLPPSVAAPRPARLAPEGAAAPRLAFPREEMLRLH